MVTAIIDTDQSPNSSLSPELKQCEAQAFLSTTKDLNFTPSPNVRVPQLEIQNVDSGNREHASQSSLSHRSENSSQI